MLNEITKISDMLSVPAIKGVSPAYCFWSNRQNTEKKHNMEEKGN